jgi:hypothetical protein
MRRLLLAAPFLLVLHAAAQAPEDSRPSLFFREDWKEIAAATPVTQEHVAQPHGVLSSKLDRMELAGPTLFL